MPTHTRRSFFAPTAALLAALAIAPTALSVELPNGVASGDITDTSAWLWARPAVAGDVDFVYGTDPTLASGTPLTLNTADPLAPVKSQVTGLNPATTYYYSATDAGGNTSTGTLKTAHTSGYNGLRFGVTGDWRGEVAPYPAIDNIPARQLDFLVEHGDTIYADFASPASSGFANPAQAVTLDEYRIKHNEVYAQGTGWVPARASTGVFVTIDDHEVTNDFAGGATIGTDSRFTGFAPGDNPADLINDSTLYENGLQAFQQYNPIGDQFYGATGDPRTAGERKLYRNQQFGQDAAIYVLDNRSFRDVAVDDPNLTLLAVDPTGQQFAADTARFYTEAATPGRTMLGRPQVEDLKADLQAAQDAGVTWKFVNVPEPMQRLGPTLGPTDKFEGYAAERNEILAYIDDNGIQNVVFVAADIHGTIVNDMTFNDPTTGDARTSSTWEISTGSVGFQDPLGQSLFAGASGLGLLTPQQEALYDALPIINEVPIPQLGGFANKDDFIEAVLNDIGFSQFGALAPSPISAIGLDDASHIDATTIVGDYIATHTYGWTEFEIDALTQQLLVTTYGVEPGTLNDPAIVSQFSVNPVPEPASLTLLALGAFALTRRRRG